MGFMEGFANTLSKNMETKRERRQKLEDDLFRSNYSIYLKGLEDRKEQSKKESAAKSSAEYIASRHNLPDQGVKMIQKALLGGISVEQLNKDLEAGTWDFGNVEQPTGPQNVVEEMNSPGLDVDTMDVNEYSPRVEAGRSPIATTNMPQGDLQRDASQEKVVELLSKNIREDPTKIREVMWGKSEQDLSPMVRPAFKPKNNQELEWINKLPNDPKQLSIVREKFAAMGKYAEADKVDGILNGIQSNGNVSNVDDAWMFQVDPETGKDIRVRGKVEDGVFYQLKTGGGYDEKGRPVGQLKGQVIAVADDIDLDTQKEIFKSVDPFESQKVATLSTINNSIDAIKIVNQNPAALTKTAGLVSSLQGWTNELNAAGELYNTIFGDATKSPEDKRVAWDSVVSKIRGASTKIDTSSLNEGERRLMRIQLNMVYDNLKLVGETRPSNFDVQNQMRLIFDPRPDNFATYLVQQTSANVKSLESSRESIMQSRGSLIVQSGPHAYMNNSAQEQLIRMAGTNTPLVSEFLAKTGQIDETNTSLFDRPVQEEQPQDNTQKIETDESGNQYQLIGETPDGQYFVYQDKNGKKFRRKK